MARRQILTLAEREDLPVLIGVFQEQNTALCQHLAWHAEEITHFRAENEQLRAENEWLTTGVGQFERRLVWQPYFGV